MDLILLFICDNTPNIIIKNSINNTVECFIFNDIFSYKFAPSCAELLWDDTFSHIPIDTQHLAVDSYKFRYY